MGLDAAIGVMSCFMGSTAELGRRPQRRLVLGEEPADVETVPRRLPTASPASRRLRGSARERAHARLRVIDV
jgi:hypothetical protein